MSAGIMINDQCSMFNEWSMGQWADALPIVHYQLSIAHCPLIIAVRKAIA